MDTKMKNYVSPQLEFVEIAIEQAILQASVGDYPGWGDENEL